MHFFLFVSFFSSADCGQVGIERQAHCRRGITWAFEWHQKISLGMDNSLFFFFFFLLLLLLLLCVLLLLCWRKKHYASFPLPPPHHFSPQNFSSHVQLLLLLLLSWAGWGFSGRVGSVSDFIFSIKVAKCKLYDGGGFGGGHGFCKKNIHSIPCLTLVPVSFLFFGFCEHEMMTYLITRFSTTC